MSSGNQGQRRGNGAGVVDWRQQGQRKTAGPEREYPHAFDADARASGRTRAAGGYDGSRARAHDHDQFRPEPPEPSKTGAPEAVVVARRRSLPVGWKVTIGAAALLLVYLATFTVEAGYRGVVTTLGKAQPEVLAEGLHFVVPLLQRVHKGSVQIAESEAVVSALSKEGDVIAVKIAINFHNDPVQLANLFRDIGFDAVEAKIVRPTVQNAPEAVFGQRSTGDLIARRREVGEEMKAVITERLLRRGIKLDEFTATYDLPAATLKAVEVRAGEAQAGRLATALAEAKNEAVAEAVKATVAARLKPAGPKRAAKPGAVPAPVEG